MQENEDEEEGEEVENSVEDNEGWYDAEDDEVEEEDDDDGWITPGNIKEMKQKILSEVVEDVIPAVGCLTTDFAMQVRVQLRIKPCPAWGLQKNYGPPPSSYKSNINLVCKRIFPPIIFK